MPNWCSNVLTITHEDSTMLDRAEAAFKAEKFLNEFIPLPESEKDNWYEWCTSNWGTKWDVGNKHAEGMNRNDNTLTLSFDSAWSPPITAYERLLELGFEVDAMYHEPGMDFAGTFYDGHNDHIDNLSDMSPDEFREEYPELDSAFGIADSMEMMAEEEEFEEFLDDEQYNEKE